MLVIAAVAVIYFYFIPQPGPFEKGLDDIETVLENNGYSFESIAEPPAQDADASAFDEMISGLYSIEFSGENEQLLKDTRDYLVELAGIRKTEIELFSDIKEYTSEEGELCSNLVEVLEIEARIEMVYEDIEELDYYRADLLNAGLGEEMLFGLGVDYYLDAASEFSLFSNDVLGACTAAAYPLEMGAGA